MKLKCCWPIFVFGHFDISGVEGNIYLLFGYGKAVGDPVESCCDICIRWVVPLITWLWQLFELLGGFHDCFGGVCKGG